MRVLPVNLEEIKLVETSLLSMFGVRLFDDITEVVSLDDNDGVVICIDTSVEFNTDVVVEFDIDKFVESDDDVMFDSDVDVVVNSADGVAEVANAFDTDAVVKFDIDWFVDFDIEVVFLPGTDSLVDSNDGEVSDAASDCVVGLDISVSQCVPENPSSQEQINP